MNSKTISIPEMVTITINGGVSTGKSIIMDRIEKLLISEFNAEVVGPQLREERAGNNYDNLDKWQKDMVKGTVWYIQEGN